MKHSPPKDFQADRSLPEWAKFYCEQMGWSLFPIVPNKKVPALVRWSIEATNDPKQIAEWWTKWPQANIGLDCGRSDITVLDIDRHSEEKDGFESLELLEMLNYQLPATLRSVTPTNGMHYFFTGATRNTASKIGPGIDTRGKGGMVLLPGSRTPKGIYRWIP